MKLTKVLLTALLLVLALAAPSAANAARAGTAMQQPADVGEECRNPAPGQRYCISYTDGSHGYLPCESGNICLYSNGGWKGHKVRFPAGNFFINFDDISCLVPSDCSHEGRGFNDEVSSFANNTGINYCVSVKSKLDPDQSGQAHTRMPAGSQGNPPGTIAFGWNDVISMLSTSGC